MYDSYVCVVGTVLNQPERRMITRTNALVTSFRVASHPRRYDRETDGWVDAPNLRIKVNCWRRLGEGVGSSVFVGDPVIVWGRLVTRTWKNEQGETRSSYELEADSVGHDYARGTGRFRKSRPASATTVIEDEDTTNRVNGEPTQRLDDRRPGARDGLDRDGLYRDGLDRDGLDRDGLDDDADGHFPNDPRDDPRFGAGDEVDGGDDLPVRDIPVTDLDAMTILRAAGLDPTSPDPGDEEDTGEEELSGAAPDSGGTAGRGRRRGRQPVPA